MFSSTNIRRCYVFRNNLVEDNNNLNAPESGETDGTWGVGFEWPGDYADLVQNNTIRNNVNFGVLAHEYPNPFPPTSNTVYFQNSGNRISGNPVRRLRARKALDTVSGYTGAPHRAHTTRPESRHRSP